jgi:hypothetical protein
MWTGGVISIVFPLIVLNETVLNEALLLKAVIAIVRVEGGLNTRRP